MDISIHAPTRGATIDWVSNPLCNAISIHAPTRGATGRTPSPGDGASDFNPRSHEGSDRRQPPPCGGQFLFQSTLPRGERPLPVSPKTSSITYFNPRSHEGSDFQCYADNTDCEQFQSTLPRGERQFKPFFIKNRFIFQSTLPRGERLDADLNNLPSDTISIHAPTRGATCQRL